MRNSSVQKQVVIITGPSGAGKSTLSRKLAVELGNAVDIDIENVNYMIVDGFKEIKVDNESELSFNKWNLAGDTIGLLASNFLDNNYQVIIHGHVTEELLLCIEKRVEITHKIMLLPDIASVILRDKTRGNHLSLGENMVRKHYVYFLTSGWNDFIKVDSTNEDVGTTLTRLKTILGYQVK